MGRVKKIKAKKNISPFFHKEGLVNTCPLCERKILKNQEDKHHLIPKSKGGGNKDIVLLHLACHRQIHMIFKESDLANHFNSIELLKNNQDVQNFINWIKTKPVDFLPSFRQSLKIKK